MHPSKSAEARSTSESHPDRVREPRGPSDKRLILGLFLDDLMNGSFKKMGGVNLWPKVSLSWK